MAITHKYAQLQTFSLAGSGVSAGDSEMILTEFNQINGTPLAMSNFGIQGFGTCEPASGINEEQIAFTGIVSNMDGTVTLTGISTVLDIYPYTQTANFAQGHAGGTAFVISNTAGFYGTFANKGNDESIIGKWTFLTAQRPTLTADTDTAVNTDLVTFGQLARTAIAGGTNATTSVQGFVQLATQADYDAKTAIGSTGAALVAPPNLNRATKYNDYVVSTSVSNAYSITPAPAISSYAAGQQFTFKVNATNTGAATLNVNGLGAIAIKKSISNALVADDLTVDSIVSVIYDGTNFQLTVQTNMGLFTNGTFTKNVADASTSQTIAHGLGFPPKQVTMFMTSASTNITDAALGMSQGIYNGTTTSCTYYGAAIGPVAISDVSTSFIIVFKNATGGANQDQTASITTDATNITLTWIKTGSPTGNAKVAWAATA